jgi:hypothetical protein
MEPAFAVDYLSPAMRYAADGRAEEAARAFSDVHAWPRGAAPAAPELEQVLRSAADTHGAFADPPLARRLVNMAYALAATLPGPAALAFPRDPGPLLAHLYRTASDRAELFEILSQLEGLRATCDAFPAGGFHLVKACDGVLHFERLGPTETADAIFNRTERVLVEAVGEKMTEVNPFGFTITVRQAGHSPDHSYYDIV